MNEFRAYHKRTRALETTEDKRTKYIHCQASLWVAGFEWRFKQSRGHASWSPDGFWFCSDMTLH